MSSGAPRRSRWHIEAGPPPAAQAADWLAADRLLNPTSPELGRLLAYEHKAAGHRSAHAAALTVMAVYAGHVTAAALLHWALHDEVLDLSAPNVLVTADGHGITGVRARQPHTLPQVGATVRQLHDVVLDRHLLPFADALHRRTRAGLRQLRGGIAHGCATALCASNADPDLLERRWNLFAENAPGGLAALGRVARVRRAGNGATRLVYLRRTCCLYYTSAEAVRCASCCLTSEEERLKRYAARG
ncbi:(2Fe-2S)-binding protein [Streptomyces sp. NPDC050617]|uniref:(2Fe-2S)-binding protein n=1 Tax=Streptomyces sp. NPDC050617 TaxID=3154628 RepID=UPI0034364E6D